MPSPRGGRERATRAATSPRAASATRATCSRAALGEARAERDPRPALDRTSSRRRSSSCAESPPDQISAFLRGEHPQTVALVIANLPTTELAAKVMQLIPPDEQADVAMRIALMGADTAGRRQGGRRA